MLCQACSDSLFIVTVFAPTVRFRRSAALAHLFLGVRTRIFQCHAAARKVSDQMRTNIFEEPYPGHTGSARTRCQQVLPAFAGACLCNTHRDCSGYSV